MGAQSLLTPSDLTLLGSYEIQTFGTNTSYMRGLTHRYVNGQLRFLSLTHTGILQEFAPPSAYGQRVSTTTATWNISSVTGDFTGIWWEEAKQRLWVTASIDYGDSNTYYPTRISTLTLGANGAVSNVKTVSLQGVTSKRIYGGVQAVPSWAQGALGCGPYVVGWGGYTSLAQQVSRSAMGPSMICIPDIAGYGNGAEIPASAFKVLLDTTPDQRGVRKTIPLNYFDGGDASATGVRRENPQTPPTLLPYTGAQWLSPNAQGQGWFVWGDSYYNNAAWIDTPSVRGFVAVAALCGVTGQTPNAGKCWYQNSTLHFDGRTQEVHIWDPANLGKGLMTRPSSMAELQLPRGITGSWDGDVPMANISGVTFDATTSTLYLVGFPLGNPSGGPSGQWDTGRLYAMRVGGGGSAPPPPGDTSAPSVSLTGPAGGTVSGTVALSATASDNVGVSSVWFTVDGVTVGSEDASAPYQGSWNASTAASGAHVIRALARDAAGNTGTSAAVTVNVAGSVIPPVIDPGTGGPTGLTAPIVTMTAVLGHTRQCSVTMSSAPPDNTGGWSVRFVRNGATFGSVDASAPYTQTASIGTGLSTFGATWTKGTGHTAATLTAPNVVGTCQ
ncbi:MAG: Ig-like domain-containing protein [Acidobacteriota bacterium]